MNTNTITQKKSFKIALFEGCPIKGKLTFDKENKGYLKYYDNGIEITSELFDSYNRLLINSIVVQAEVICKMRYSTLWSY